MPLYLPVPKRQGIGISLVGCSGQPKANLRDGEQPGATSHESVGSVPYASIAPVEAANEFSSSPTALPASFLLQKTWLNACLP